MTEGAALLRQVMLTIATDAKSTDVLCDALDALAAATGDNRVRHAARVAREPTGGRPRLDDAEAVERVLAMVRTGSKPWPACRRVAAEMTGAADEISTAKRLLRKAEKSFHETGFVNGAIR